MKANRQVKIDSLYDAIDVVDGTTCLFPTEGEGSIENIIAEYGDDIDAITQSATWFLVAEDGNTFCLEDADSRPFIGSAAGIFPMRTGDLWQGPNGDNLVATTDGWEDAETADIDTYGAAA